MNLIYIFIRIIKAVSIFEGLCQSNCSFLSITEKKIGRSEMYFKCVSVKIFYIFCRIKCTLYETKLFTPVFIIVFLIISHEISIELIFIVIFLNESALFLNVSVLNIILNIPFLY